MKPSDYFKTMEEVKAYVEGQRPYLSDEEYKSLKLATGLNEQMGKHVEIEGVGQIDKTIAPIIILLNQCGYCTNSSCSGLKSEHEEWKDYDFRGYIAVVDDGDEIKKNKLRDIVSALPFSFEEEEVYLKQAYIVRVSGTDEHKNKSWEMLQKKLEECLALE
ncbi:hypothetical protein [Parasporobacterium paucivorans]|uniref:Uncharacterized protein n=1 Tax=Parasporobacterium paucivorans DSM 15970 TaxID=1122934 RepID=A0A1M6GMR5_9FIRM|nr:hypothetical protein [Parasporobacterium paucivorans]SHJ11203.1 hypothetical protein SAMN02745691_01366 [Parasporobacterium paucivorans DSM 15970]